MNPPPAPANRFNWVAIVVLPIGSAALTVCWVTLWERWGMRLAVSDTVSAPMLSPLAMMAFVLGGAFVTRVALLRRRAPDGARRMVAGFGLAAVALGLWLTYGARSPDAYAHSLFNWGRYYPPALLTIIVVTFLWWRGITIGRNDAPHDDLSQTFYNGIVAFTFLFVLNSFHRLIAAPEALGPVMLFFTVGMGALALAGVEEDRRRQKDSSGQWPGLNRHWVATVGGIIAVVVSLGLALAAVVAPETFSRILAALAPIANALTVVATVALVAVVSVVIYPIFYIVGLLWGLIQFTPSKTPEQPTDEAAQQAREALDRLLHLPAVQSASRLLATLIILSIIILVFWLAVRRLRLFPGQAGADETRESILSRELLWRQFKNLFSRWRPAPPATAPPYVLLNGDDPRLIIRRAYQRLLAWGTASGHPRQPAQTPEQYARSLASAVGRAQAAIAALTALYTPARYAAQPPTAAEAARAQTELDRIVNPVSEKGETKP